MEVYRPVWPRMRDKADTGDLQGAASLGRHTLEGCCSNLPSNWKLPSSSGGMVDTTWRVVAERFGESLKLSLASIPITGPRCRTLKQRFCSPTC